MNANTTTNVTSDVEITPEEREEATEEFRKLARQAASAKDYVLAEHEVNDIALVCIQAVDTLSVFGSYIAGALLTSLARSYAAAIENDLKEAA
jgi:transcription antitermination factor NusG